MKLSTLLAAALFSFTPPNIVVILCDDWGVDKAFHAYPGAQPDLPNLLAFRTRALEFTNAYVCPVCSPTRACLLTGRYPFRTGVGTTVAWQSFTFGLPLSEITLAEILPHTSAVVGKWHLSSLSSGGLAGPGLQGFGYFDVAMGNLGDIPGEGYYDWTHNFNGVMVETTEYATIYQVDAAISWMTSAPTPFFLYLPTSAPHNPWHNPPADLQTYDLTNPTIPLQYDAAMQALDTKLGEFLAAVPRNTYVFILGDNGTPDLVVDGSPFLENKGTVYEGGVRVPLLVVGPKVQPGTCAALVHGVDVFATILDICHSPASRQDGVSFRPCFQHPEQSPRTSVFVQKFAPNGFGVKTVDEWAVRDARYKLLYDNEAYSLFDLLADPYEYSDLLLDGTSPAEQQIIDVLLSEKPQ